MTEVLNAALMGLLTRVEGWTAEEVNIFIAKIRKDMNKKSAHVLQELYVFHRLKDVSHASANHPKSAMLCGPKSQKRQKLRSVGGKCLYKLCTIEKREDQTVNI